MDLKLKEQFLGLWERYFPGAELPVTFYYTNEKDKGKIVPPPAGWSCFISELARVRGGKSLVFDKESVGGSGGQRYLGFSQELRPNFEYFLSCGIPGKLESERYKKTPRLVTKGLEWMPAWVAPARYVVFKRWDSLEQSDNPEVVVFFATADVLSGLFTLANFDQSDPYGVAAPFAAGCGSIVLYSYLQRKAESPKAVLGLFDVSARPCVPGDRLSFAVPAEMYYRMIGNMQESFFITDSWDKVHKRIEKARKTD